ncbi:hypothetical protein ACFVR1_07130 [Psychrobacillus sp. NPDC058041]|uniref:hypothetical protein n=1 Tax=Psychrobacillus sp. NPDC058041 TaxID=3346310 RepID=UPI0036DF84B9
MKNFLKILFATVIFASFPIANGVSANAATFGKIMWGKTELKIGQIGKVTVLQDTTLVKLESNGSLTPIRTLKKGDEYRVYTYKSNFNGLYGVGSGSFVQKNTKIKYETPSKKKLEILTLQKLFQEARLKQYSITQGTYTKQDILTLFNTNFTDEFTSQFISSSMLKKEINGVTHYYFPTNTDHINTSLFVENSFSWTEQTIITYDQTTTIDKDNKKGIHDYVKISEYQKGNDLVKPHTYTIVLLKLENGSYKIVDIQKQFGTSK